MDPRVYTRVRFRYGSIHHRSAGSCRNFALMRIDADAIGIAPTCALPLAHFLLRPS
jgi:hypothetical protein